MIVCWSGYPQQSGRGPHSAVFSSPPLLVLQRHAQTGAVRLSHLWPRHAGKMLTLSYIEGFFSLLMTIQFIDCIQKRGLLIDFKSEHRIAGYVQSLEKY